MKLIVGLGNPGNEYKNTRHNIGFFYLDEYAKKNGFTISKNKFNGLYETMQINNDKVIFLKPVSYMNLSGTVVRDFVNYYKISPEDIMVIQDDLDMEIAKIKIKSNSSSGGHNGIKNIIENINSKNFIHLKVGISNNKNMDTKDYVLGQFSKDEVSLLEDKIETVNSIITDFINGYSCDKLMMKYNGVKNANI